MITALMYICLAPVVAAVAVYGSLVLWASFLYVIGLFIK